MFNYEKNCLESTIDIDLVIGKNEELKKENEKLRAILGGKVLIVEDGSVNIKQLEEDGFYVIPYRQGAKPPMWITHQHEDNGE